MMDQEWIRVLGYRDVPGKPAMLGTTNTFLDYFNLSSLRDLPSLAAIKDMETLEPELAFESNDPSPIDAEQAADDDHEVRAAQTERHEPSDELSDPENESTENAS